MTMTRCGIYSRVSTSKQESENQLAQLSEFARVMGWHVDAETVYVDQITGKHSESPEFQRMFQDASRRKFDVLLFWSLDRLSREGALETLQHFSRLTGHGVQWRSLTEQYLDSTGMFREAVISITGGGCQARASPVVGAHPRRIGAITAAGEVARTPASGRGLAASSRIASTWAVLGSNQSRDGSSGATCQRALQD